MPVKFKIFSDFPGLACNLSESHNGSMNLRAESGEGAENYAAHRREFIRKIGLRETDLVFARSVHGAKIARVGSGQRGIFLEGYDGLIANESGTFLAVTVADCVPVYLFDPAKLAWGLVHAGWRGIAAGIIPEVLRQMSEKFQSRPEDLLLATGPAIQKCHFEVKFDALEKFRDYPECVVRGETITLDLPAVIRAQAERFGIKSEQVELSNLCTFCEEKRYFSFRRDHKQPLETMLACIGYRELVTENIHFS